jgi:hypothetical protein
MPLSGNTLTSVGLGPWTMRDTFLELNPILVPQWLTILWVIITAIAVASMAVLLQYLFGAAWQVVLAQKKAENNQHWLKILIISTISIYLLPVGINGFFERYLLFVIRLIMLIVLPDEFIKEREISKKIIAMALSLVLLSGIFAIAGTHDYLLWNRVRWQALNNLRQSSGISPNYIDGGFEFNGWYLYNPVYKEKPGKSWWWVDRDDYIITFGNLSGYEEVKRYPLSRWLPFGPEKIMVLHKNKPQVNN